MLVLAGLTIYVLGVVTLATGICWVALVIPWGVLHAHRARISEAFIAASALGASACVLYAFLVYRQGLDGYWWPVMAAFWSSGWLVVVSGLLVAVKALALVGRVIKARRAERT